MNDLSQWEQWIQQQIALAGLTFTAPIEPVKQSATATILRVQSNQGVLFFKAPMPSFAFEARLTAALSRWFPAVMPRLLAVEETLGWLLMYDAGITLKQLSQTEFELDRWLAMLRQYAALQQAVTTRAPALLNLGLPDRRLSQLPTLYQALLSADDAPTILLLDQPDGITSDQLHALQAAISLLHDLCAQLAAFNIPETLHHDDFHVGNVTLRGDQLVFIDWAESCLAHPFYSLMLSLRYAKLVFHCDEQQLDQLRDAYLERWTNHASLTVLRRVFTVASQLGALCRALTWAQVARGVSAEDRAEYADAVPYWLLTFLHNTPLQA